MQLRPLALALSLLAGCGGAEERPLAPDGIGTSHAASGGQCESGGRCAAAAQRPSAAEGAVELALRRADGTFLDVGELRGEVVLLFVFATFDGVSQMILTPLRAVAEAHPEVRIVGIAAQPNARMLVDAYEHALRPPFPVGYDPEEGVREGTSALGPIGVIPVLVALDRRGVEVDRHLGYVERARIEEMLRAAGVR